VPAAFGTIVAKRELPYARVLAQSLAEHHPELRLFVLLADEIQGCFDPAEEPFELLAMDDLRIPAAARFRFLHRRQPLSYASTPYFLTKLLELGFEKVVFIKQESIVLGDQRPVLDALANSAIVLTPHLLEPPGNDSGHARELNILLSGTFNCGLVGIRQTDVTREFLAWWRDRVFAHCRHAIGEGCTTSSAGSTSSPPTFVMSVSFACPARTSDTGICPSGWAKLHGCFASAASIRTVLIR
jgi:hypothetical protein